MPNLFVIEEKKKEAMKKYQEISGRTVYESGICVSLDSPHLADPQMALLMMTL